MIRAVERSRAAYAFRNALPVRVPGEHGVVSVIWVGSLYWRMKRLSTRNDCRLQSGAGLDRLVSCSTSCSAVSGPRIAWCYRLTAIALLPDLAQDVLIKAYSSFDMFRQDSKFSCRHRPNRCRDHARARAARRREVPKTRSSTPVRAERRRWRRSCAMHARCANADGRRADETENASALHCGHDMRSMRYDGARLDQRERCWGAHRQRQAKLNAAVTRWKKRSRGRLPRRRLPVGWRLGRYTDGAPSRPGRSLPMHIRGCLNTRRACAPARVMA